MALYSSLGASGYGYVVVISDVLGVGGLDAQRIAVAEIAGGTGREVDVHGRPGAAARAGRYLFPLASGQANADVLNVRALQTTVPRQSPERR